MPTSERPVDRERDLARLNPGSAVCWVQGTYYLVSGAWPIVHIDSFQAVTGTKTDLWLVKTVAALVIVVAAVLLVAAWRKRMSLEIFLLGVLSAVVLAGIDIYYSMIVDWIDNIYMLDAAAEIVILAGWLWTGLKNSF